jgi:hypothetical protein
MKVDQQAERHIKQLHVGKKLGFVNRKDFFHRFDFNDKATIHENIEAQGFIELQAFVIDEDRSLLNCRDALQNELTHHAFFINALDQARTFESMHFDGRSDYFA